MKSKTVRQEDLEVIKKILSERTESADRFLEKIKTAEEYLKEKVTTRGLFDFSFEVMNSLGKTTEEKMLAFSLFDQFSHADLAGESLEKAGED